MLTDIVLRKGIERDKQHYSFVGIERNKDNDQLEFWLPLGFENFPENDFRSLKNFFFKMYRTFSIYLKRKENRLQEGAQRDKFRDGFYEAPGGFCLENEAKDDIVLYSKINAINKVIEGYDELKISSLEKKQKRTDEIDYSKIHRYLHKAIYLNRNVLFIDEMNLTKNVIILDSPPLIQLFSFIFTEIKTELSEVDSIPDKAFELADIFKDTYFQPDTTLFGSNEMLNKCIGVMREVLEEIEITTVYKDEDYWHFYDAVESFLYSEKSNEEGLYWGISNFYDIWEDMCQTYFLNIEPYKSNVLFADLNGSLIDYNKLKINPFEISLNREPNKRYLKPDLVLNKLVQQRNISFDDIFDVKLYSNQRWIDVALKLPEFEELYYRFWNFLTPGIPKSRISPNEHKEMIRFGSYEKARKIIEEMISHYQRTSFTVDNTVILIVDYKYMAELAYHTYNEYSIDVDGENKIKYDIKKQLIYEWAVQNTVSQVDTESEFWIPYYSTQETEQLIKKYIDINNARFNESQIRIVKIPFNVLQDHYLRNWKND